MDDNLNDILSEEGAPLTTYQAIIRVLVKMWQAARDEVRSAAHTADRLRPVAVAAAILAALSLAGCLYLGTVVHRQQGEINSIHRILEEGVVVEETTTTEIVTTQTIEGDTATINKDIREELEGAEHYAKLATEYKDENHSLADTYATMASQELNHVDMLHVQVVKIIQAYRDKNGAPPDAMMAVWNWEHESMVDKTAKIRVLLDMYKR